MVLFSAERVTFDIGAKHWQAESESIAWQWNFRVITRANCTFKTTRRPCKDHGSSVSQAHGNKGT